MCVHACSGCLKRNNEKKKKKKKNPGGRLGVWAAGRDEQKKQRREMRSSALPVRI